MRSWMPVMKIKELKVGDIIRHAQPGSKSMLVTATYGDRATAVRTADLTNPTEWLMLSRRDEDETQESP